MLEWGSVGPLQSYYLFHFTGRSGSHTSCIPEEMRDIPAA
jgi:hypothetical protein